MYLQWCIVLITLNKIIWLSLWAPLNSKIQTFEKHWRGCFKFVMSYQFIVYCNSLNGLSIIQFQTDWMNREGHVYMKSPQISTPMVLIFHLSLTLKGQRVSTYNQMHKLYGPHQVQHWLFPVMRAPGTPYNYIHHRRYWTCEVLAFRGPDKSPRAVSGKILDKTNWDPTVCEFVSREIFRHNWSKS